MAGLQRLGAWITRNPLIIIVAAVLLTFVSIHYAQQIESQGMNTESFVETDSTLYQIYNHLYAENFGMDTIVILMEADDVAEKEALLAGLRLSDHMKQFRNVVSVQSLADLVADAEYSSGGIRRIPSQEKIDEILSKANSDQLKTVMADRRHARMIAGMPTTLTDVQRNELLAETTAAVKLADFPPDYGTTITGDPAFQAAIVEEMNKSNVLVFALAAMLMVVALLLVFRHVRWSLLPIPIVLLGIIWTFGAMGLLHIPMTMVSFAAFPVLIGIGIDYAIQFHNRMNEERIGGKPPVEAAVSTVSNVALPVIIALMVTEAGFLSLLSSPVPMIKDFGRTCIIGLVMCYLSALFVNMIILYLSEMRWPRPKREEGTVESTSMIVSSLEKTANFVVQRWRIVLVLALFLGLFGNYTDTMVQVEADQKNFIPQDLPPLVDLNHMKAIFGGTDSIKYVVQAEDITIPENLRWMDDFSSYMIRSRDRVVSATSIATYIKLANGGEIPDDQTKIRQIIASLPRTVQDTYVSGYNTADIDINIGDAQTTLGTEGVAQLVSEFEKDLTWMTPPPSVSVVATGDIVLNTSVKDALSSGRLEMTLLGLMLIFIVLLFIYRDIVKALLVVLPMLVVIGWMGLVMYYGGLKYTPLTATLGALVLGVGSEYAILMMERFYEELKNVGNPYEAMKITVNRIGSALVASGMTVFFGFAALVASPFDIISNFGLVTVLSVVFALFTTFTVLVVLMIRMELRREVMENAKQERKRAIALMNNQG
ncbi:MAG: RND family transporter [Methanothrix sp.]|nr:RND family transporter [Methanothrix sp.]